MGKQFQHVIQQHLASGLVISFRLQLLAHLRHMQERHFEMTEWIACMFTTKFARYWHFL